MKLRSAVGAAGMTLVLMSGTANASYLIDFVQDASGVTVTGLGSFNTSTLGAGSPISDLDSGINAARGLVIFSPGSVTTYNATFSGDTAFGTTGAMVSSSYSGDLTAFSVMDGYIDVPVGYISGSLLSSSMTFSGASFASLGINPGTFTFTYGGQIEIDAAFASRVAVLDPNSITVQIGPSGVIIPSPVSLPGAAPMFGAALLGMAGIGYAARRKKDAAAA